MLKCQVEEVLRSRPCPAVRERPLKERTQYGGAEQDARPGQPHHLRGAPPEGVPLEAERGLEHQRGQEAGQHRVRPDVLPQPHRPGTYRVLIFSSSSQLSFPGALGGVPRLGGTRSCEGSASSQYLSQLALECLRCIK